MILGEHEAAQLRPEMASDPKVACQPVREYIDLYGANEQSPLIAKPSGSNPAQPRLAATLANALRGQGKLRETPASYDHAFTLRLYNGSNVLIGTLLMN